MPVEVLARDDPQKSDNNVMQTSRLSSFGYSGTIAHGAFEARKTIVSMSYDSTSLYRKKSLLIHSKHQYSPMRRIALALRQTGVKVEETHTVCCREQIVTLTNHRGAPNTSDFGNQTQIADEMEF